MDALLRIKWGTVLVGLIALPVLYGASDFLLNVAVDNPAKSEATWRLLTPFTTAILWLGPGCITGYLAGQSPLKHGLALGGMILLAAFAFLALFPSVGTPEADMNMPPISGFLAPLVIGSVAGAYIGNFIARRRGVRRP
jgi:hypothetical protein